MVVGNLNDLKQIQSEERVPAVTYFLVRESDNKIVGMINIRLTLNECYMLMGYPNNFIKDSNKSNAYLQCGNSVVIPMITSIANEIINQGFLGGKNGVFGRNLQELNFGCI